MQKSSTEHLTTVTRTEVRPVQLVQFNHKKGYVAVVSETVQREVGCWTLSISSKTLQAGSGSPWQVLYRLGQEKRLGSNWEFMWQSSQDREAIAQQ